MSKIALISDVHGNLPALESVLELLDRHSPDLWICLGDLVGYGPFPSECISIVKERGMITVLGNHDAGVVGKLNLKHFRNPNRKLIEMSQSMLNEEQMEWLSNRPYSLTDNSIWIAAHASPLEPNKWTYIDSAIKARKVLNDMDVPLCFVGHTHVPAMVSSQIGNMSFVKGNKYLINPGSVGQSRDDDFRASCCLIDTEKWEVENFRVEYNTEKALYALSKLGFNRGESHRLLRC